MSPTFDNNQWYHRHGRRQRAEAERESICGMDSIYSFQHTPFMNEHQRASYRWIVFRWSRRQCSIRTDIFREPNDLYIGGGSSSFAVFGGGVFWCFAEEEILRKYLFRMISIGNIHGITSLLNWIYVFHSWWWKMVPLLWSPTVSRGWKWDSVRSELNSVVPTHTIFECTPSMQFSIL